VPFPDGSLPPSLPCVIRLFYWFPFFFCLWLGCPRRGPFPLCPSSKTLYICWPFFFSEHPQYLWRILFFFLSFGIPIMLPCFPLSGYSVSPCYFPILFHFTIHEKMVPGSVNSDFSCFFFSFCFSPSLPPTLSTQFSRCQDQSLKGSPHARKAFPQTD